MSDKFLNVKTNGVVVIPNPRNSSNKWCLKSIVINTKGASSNKATLYDSNEEIGEDPQKRIGSIDTTVVPGNFDYDLILNNGIYIVVETGTAPDLTIVYRETA